MWDSLRRGFGFLKQSAAMAAKDPDLLKPSIYALLVGGLATVLLAVPALVLTFLAGDTDLGRILLAALAFLTFFVQFTISYIFSGMTVRLVYDYLTNGDGRMDQAWATVRRDLFDIMTLAAVSAAVKLLETLANQRKQKQRSLLSALAAGLASLLNRIWTVATYFILPAMIIEDLNLGRGVKRATQIIKDNLLLVAVTEIGVGAVVGLIGFLLVILALALGAGLIVLIGALSNWAVEGVLIGAAAGILVAFAIIIAVIVFSSYITTAYHTCLFLWAREVEQARTQGIPDVRVAAPAPIAAVMA
ncbi:MAG: hypothetical protein JW929_06640 [Anaerolineales bacterium]|nr:hypothetical protein [Anaerolineales bacterium]